MLLVLVPPFALGGRYAWGQLVLVLLVLSWAVAWLVNGLRSGRLELEWSWSYLLWLGGCSLAIAQIAPLSEATRDALSPRIRELLPLLTSDTVESAMAGLEPWRFLSLTPGRTVEGLAIFLCLGAVWFLAVQQLRTAEHVRKLLAVMFAAGLLIAVFGLIQWIFWNGRFYWLFDVPGIPTHRQLHGPFTNRNHFAGFLALTIGPACYWVVELLQEAKTGGRNNFSNSGWLGLSQRSPGHPELTGVSQTSPQPAAAVGNGLCAVPTGSRRNAAEGVPSRLGALRLPWEVRLFGALVGLATILAACLLSLSRGGAIVAVMALCCAGGGLAVVVPELRKGLLVLGSFCAFVAGCLSVVGLPAILERLGTLSWENLAASAKPEGRLSLWSALLRAVSDFPIFGTGFGSHRYIYPLYMTASADGAFTHAENCYLQLWVEGGLIALNLAVIALLMVGCWSVRAIRFGNRSIRSLAVAISGSLLAAAVHAAVDFVWYVPAYAVALLMLAAAAYRLSRLSCPAGLVDGAQSSVFAVPRILRWAMVAALAIVGCAAISHFARKTTAEHAWLGYIRRLESVEKRPEQDTADAQGLRIELLKRCLAARPDDSEAHLKLAQIYACQCAQAETAEQRQRYRACVRMHCQEAVRGCPLLGEAYVVMATQVAPASEGSGIAAAYAAQAVRVRPHQPDICFAAGYELFKQQRPAAALACWKLAANCGWEWEQRVVQLVAPHTDPQTLVAHLAPSPRALVWAAEHCCNDAAATNKQHELLTLAKVQTENSVTARPSHSGAADLLLLHQICRRLGDNPAADQAMERYVRVSGRNFESVLEQAKWYLATGRSERAHQLLERCRAERPNDPDVRRLVGESMVSTSGGLAEPAVLESRL
ncbi:MAG: O-antigen ligase family protein [Planctomycetes bacterium]|nr:O-antigen ligase family protein [Planctomycetota bacterium]